MRKFFSFRYSCSSGIDKPAPSELNRSRKISSRETEGISDDTSTQERILDGFQTPEDYILKPQNQNLLGDSSIPYLQTSLSLTSAATAICNNLNEGSFSSSIDHNRMTSCCDNDQHVGPYPHVHQNSSPSTSACSSPVIIRYRTARLFKIPSQNSSQDLCSDGEHKITKANKDSKKCAFETDFQAEKQRLCERVRELIEQNESLQREIFSFQGSELEIRNSVVNIERQLNESRSTQDELKAENLNLRQALLELQERCNWAEEHLQRTCNEQENTISGLRQSYSTELEKKFLVGDIDVIQLQTEKMWLTGVEKKLRKELECCRIETESLRHKNIHLLNRLQGTKNRCGLSLDDMEVELMAEAILTRLLREKIYSRELEIAQLERDLTSSIRRCDQLSTDIQALKDEISCLNHEKRDIEIQQEFQQCSRDLNVTRSMLTKVSEERDHVWEKMNCELKSLNKKIELLDEDILYKEGQISILKDYLRSKPFDII